MQKKQNLLHDMLKFRKVYARIKLELFSLSLSFLLPTLKKKSNYYISLGSNCFARYKLTAIGMKPKKKDGELSCPFDLCWTTPNDVARILDNNFEDYIENIETIPAQAQRDNKYIYRNKKYNIDYIHDCDLTTLEEMKSRYKKRIENFLTLSKNQKELVYLQFIFDNEFDPQDLNRIYNSLTKYRQNKPFKYAVFSFTDQYTNSKEKINPNILYKEYIPECGTQKYKTDWHSRDLFWTDSVIEEVCKDICKL